MRTKGRTMSDIGKLYAEASEVRPATSQRSLSETELRDALRSCRTLSPQLLDERQAVARLQEINVHINRVLKMAGDSAKGQVEVPDASGSYSSWRSGAYKD